MRRRGSGGVGRAARLGARRASLDRGGHAAGVVDDATIEALTDAHIDDVMRSKVTAAWHLHEATAELPLTAFVLYSSIAGTLGTLGQGNYAAANVFLDALAEHRQASGLPATAMAWGFWADRSGATGHLSDGDVARMARSGIAPMTSDEGLALFDASLSSGSATTVPARLDVAALRTRSADGQVPPLLRRLAGTGDAVRRTAAGSTLPGAALTSSASSPPRRGASSAVRSRRFPKPMRGSCSWTWCSRTRPRC